MPSISSLIFSDPAALQPEGRNDMRRVVVAVLGKAASSMDTRCLSEV